ncbi:Myc-type, basic helix-loop-helix domain-containing protein [Gilbertella persicaria]|uniref:Myc-type, basic helix-loop-helix domain-containing protein n=1 Tax=Gilbertella persicaria TaxID=101096 RepID=UPI002220FEC9|nr:Myc-type, basic helix-loop-helix domain-containing protein [Gilbertella persicaria]KAI8094961.1 Myc-type, basic helix-loop-helix domain-containing protein [Gilbertella persicaria]
MTPAATTADQREKARKISHSAIERRRRERINDKIFQLKQLIPSCVEQDNLHKMSILQSAIDYIIYLKDVVKKLDEESGGDQLLKGNHLKVKTAKSMLPKEVEPFTNQFPPIDVIKSGTPIISTGVTPLTPPQEPQNNNKVSETLCLSDSPTLSNKSRISEEAKHMSLQNILC